MKHVPNGDEMQMQLNFFINCGIEQLPRTQNYVFRREKGSTNGGKSVAGVGNKQTGFAHSTIPNSDALDEPRSAHLWNSEKRKEDASYGAHIQ